MFKIKRRNLKKRISSSATLNLQAVEKALQVLDDNDGSGVGVVDGRNDVGVGGSSSSSFLSILTMMPRKPMLAQAIKSWNNIPLPGYIEEKFDGERLLLVYNKDTGSKYYTRNLKPMAHYSIQPTFNDNIKSIILDGELVYYEDGKIITRATVKNLLTSIKQYHVFDIQQYNGEDVSILSFQQRKEILSSLLPKEFVFVPYMYVESIEEVKQKYNEVCSRNGEGLVLKRKEDSYKPDYRGWFKLKPYYLSGTNNIISLCVDRILYNKNKVPDRAVCGYLNRNNDFIQVATISSGMNKEICSDLVLACASKTRPIVEIMFDTSTNNSFRSAKILCVRNDLEYKDICDEIKTFIEKK